MKKVITIILSAIFCFALFAGCDKENKLVDSEYQPIYEAEASGYTYDGQKTAAPYRVFNQDGTLIDRYSSLFRALQQAGVNGKSSNLTYVLDQTGLKVFQRQSMSDYWCYDGTRFVGTKPAAEALEWSRGKSRSYVLNGQGSGYMRLGNTLMPGSVPPVEGTLELFSGSYNYMFSKYGEPVSASDFGTGYGYMRGYVMLSQARYKPPQDGADLGLPTSQDSWNAYIFFNHKGGGNNIDLGLIGNYYPESNDVRWRLVRNCSYGGSSNAHQGDNFWVMRQPEYVTKMTYDEEKGDYTGADDLLFEVWAGVNGWKLKITNMTDGSTCGIDETHLEMHNTQHDFRFLMAASYCPVYRNGQVWNARCGGYLKNVIFSDVKISRYDSTVNLGDPYLSSTYEDFYPGSENMHYGFSQSADGADFSTGTFATGGYYKGNQVEYAAGTRYTTFSCYYDGSHPAV